MMFIGFNSTFAPLFALGLMGMPRRVVTYPSHLQTLNIWVSVSAFVLGASMLVFLFNVVYSLVFVRKPAEANARSQAIADARSKAEAMANAGGVKVGPLLSVSDFQQSGYSGPVFGASAADSGGRATVVPVGDLDVAIRVQVQFAIG
jgi:heme/copper-type cytochrome/quinol oxidase subunit 1